MVCTEKYQEYLKVQKKILRCALISVVISCSSTQKNMDISLEKPITPPEPLKNETVEQSKSKESASATNTAVQDKLVSSAQKKTMEIKYSVKEVFEWQRSFKSAPNEEERAQIAKQLEMWKEIADPTVLYKKAKFQLALGLIADAEVAFREVQRADHTNKDVFLDLAGVYLRQKEFTKCFEYLEAAKKYISTAEVVPFDFKFKYKFTLGQALIGQGEVKDGRRIMSDLIAFDKGFTPGYAVLANSYIDQGKLDQAEFIALRGLDRGTKDARLLNIVAVIASKKGDKIKAEQWIQKSLEVDANYAPALINRANQAIFKAQYEPAEADLKKAIKLDPDNASAHISVGILFKKTGRYDLARNSFERSIDLEPESSYARYNLGLLHLEYYKDETDALRLLRETLQTADRNEEVKSLAKNQIDLIKNNSAFQ